MRWSRAEPTSRPLCVLFCDLDEFKNVNDSLGHGIGDEVLIEVGRRALLAVRSGRHRGPARRRRIRHPDRRRRTAPRRRPSRSSLLAALAEPIVVDGHSISARASIGIARAVPGEVAGHRRAAQRRRRHVSGERPRQGHDRGLRAAAAHRSAGPAGAAVRPAARDSRGRTRPALPADRRSRRPEPSPGSRPWCAGSIRSAG